MTDYEAKTAALLTYGERYEKGQEEILEKVAQAYLPQIKFLSSSDEGIKICLKSALMMHLREHKEMVKRLDEIEK